jgi:MtN3 and saliva related transmembrane protein
MSRDLIGWASSFVLLLTLATQTWKQYKSGSTRGVSKWLYIGEMVAAGGFVAYSVLLRNPVYVVSNALGVVTSLCGLVIFARNRQREEREGATAHA